MAEVDARSSDSQGHDFLSFDTTTACNTLVIEKCFWYSFQELFCRFLMSAPPVQTPFDPSDSNLRLLLSYYKLISLTTYLSETTKLVKWTLFVFPVVAICCN